MSDWIFDHMGVVFIIGLALFAGGIWKLAGAIDKQNKKDCAKLMTYTQTPHDTLEVQIACMRMEHPDSHPVIVNSVPVYSH